MANENMNKAQKAAAMSSSSMALTYHEIFTKVNPKIQWDLPKGNPPYLPNEAPVGTEHTFLESEAKRLWHFVQGADQNLSKVKKETLYIQILEGLHETEAELLVAVKEKKLNNMYKGLTANLVKEAFGWNDDFVKLEA